jgi:hypothetical protein
MSEKKKSYHLSFFKESLKNKRKNIFFFLNSLFKFIYKKKYKIVNIEIKANTILNQIYYSYSSTPPPKILEDTLLPHLHPH